MNEKYITKEVRGKLFKFLQSLENVYVGDEKKCKKFVEACFWMVREGEQWRYLPFKYGKWNSVFKRYNAWSKKGVFNDLLEWCATDSDCEYIMLDSTIVRAHASAAGYGDQNKEGLGRSKDGFTSKIHV